MRIFLLILSFCAAALFFAGCGKKGNLYLPTDPVAVPSTQPAQK